LANIALRRVYIVQNRFIFAP